MVSYFRVGVSLALLLIYCAVMITSIISTALPVAYFTDPHGTNTFPTISLWENCSHTNSTQCTDLKFYCMQSRVRFNVARAFNIMTIFFSVFCIICAAVALGQLLGFSDTESAVRALYRCVRVGVVTLIFSIIAVALSVVVNSSPLCEGFTRLEDMDGWELGEGPISAAVCACFALVGSCFGRLMETRISTSTLGV